MMDPQYKSGPEEGTWFTRQIRNSPGASFKENGINLEQIKQMFDDLKRAEPMDEFLIPQQVMDKHKEDKCYDWLKTHATALYNKFKTKP